MKLFICVFLFSFYIIYQYNELEAQSFNMEFHGKITKVYDTIRKVTPFYLNTNMVELEKGTYTRDDVSIMVHEKGRVKELSLGINLLEKELRKYIGDDYWSIAILQKSETNANTAHFKPFHQVHGELNSKLKFDQNWMYRILDNENIPKTYQAFSECDLKLTEPYIERFSEQKIRTIFYPIYVNKNLSAMFLLDIKDEIFSHWLKEFNHRQSSFLYYALPERHFFHSKAVINIPCTPINNQLGLSIQMEKVFSVSVFIACLLTTVFLFIEKTLRNLVEYCTKDHMTGLYRRDMHEIRLNRTQGNTIIIIDIDHFKTVNDQYGHLHGDAVIQEVCTRIKQNLRGSDLAIRWGGEEFVIVLKNISYHGLLNRTEAIRQSIDVKPIAGINVSVSIGATTGQCLSFKTAFKIADTALYQSKRSGRNRVTVVKGVTK